MDAKKYSSVDVSMLRQNLRLTIEARIHQHQTTLDCISQIRGLAKSSYEQSRRTHQISDKKSG